ncbi:hypothetical protein [Emticicia aquatica]|uniref:hypothetical protein n=1 Tax=Emticicia aquatica TaxID=1681835 RepID=UPI001EEA6F1F|nr:hypothetical protein [Emticicia aquatica]
METIIVIGFLLLGLLTSFSLIFFSKQFFFNKPKSDFEQKKQENFFRRIKYNSVRIKHIHA